VDFTITVTNADEVTRRFRRYGRHLGTWRSLWRGIGADLARAQRAWWASKGEGSWPPLKPATVREKQRLGYGRRPMLVRTGELRRAMTQQRRFVAARSGDVLLVQIPPEVAYGRFHQTGAPRANLPRRRVLLPTSRMRQIARRRLRDHVRYRGKFG
jgi:phage gpG-like protein